MSEEEDDWVDEKGGYDSDEMFYYVLGTVLAMR